MLTPIPRTGRPPRPPPPRRRAQPNRSARSCRWSSSAKGVLDPDDAVRAVGYPLHGQHIEAHHAAAPLCLPLQKELSGANDSALLAPGDGGQRSAEIDPYPLAYLDDRQHAAVEAYQVEFAGPASHIACEHGETPRLQIFGREPFGCGAALDPGIGGHARKPGPAMLDRLLRYLTGF